jgi:hypothetical protein
MKKIRDIRAETPFLLFDRHNGALLFTSVLQFVENLIPCRNVVTF